MAEIPALAENRCPRSSLCCRRVRASPALFVNTQLPDLLQSSQQIRPDGKLLPQNSAFLDRLVVGEVSGKRFTLHGRGGREPERGTGGGQTEECVAVVLQKLSHQRGYKGKRVVVAVTDKVDLTLLQCGNIPNVQLR